jgi:Mrp family chromosome partitioning ATPase
VDGTPGLDVLGPGPLPPYPSELLASDRTKATLYELAEMYDMVLIDSPPVLAVTDALVLTKFVDVVVVVASKGSTSRRGIVAAFDELAKVAAPIGGLVLNRIELDRSGRYGYGYGYGEDAYGSDPIDRKPFDARPLHSDIASAPDANRSLREGSR